MLEVHTIQRLILSSFRHFGHCDLDFCDPETGETLSRVCFHGPNGVGKSTVLRCLRSVLHPGTPPVASAEAAPGGGDGLVLAKLSFGDRSSWLVRALGEEKGGSTPRSAWFSEGIETTPAWESMSASPLGFDDFAAVFAEWALTEEESPAEMQACAVFLDESAGGSDVGSLEALISRSQQERESAFLRYLSQPQSQERSVAEVRQRFEDLFPDPVEGVRQLWEESARHTGLALLTEPALGFHRLADGEPVGLGVVSPALRRFLTHALEGSLRLVDSGENRSFLFLDAPEASLGGELPRRLASFLLERACSGGGQAFLATLDPGIVSLFAEAEVVRLDFSETYPGKVEVVVPPEADEDEGGEEGEDESDGGIELAMPFEIDEDERLDPATLPLASLKQAIQETEDQEELADLIDRLISMRKR